ncbi:MAG: hypothetical protein ABSH36_05800 [Solirubrobacteraceae bacterium]|jgi:hypothetical protein
MTRIKLAGLCLVAVFAFGAVAVAQASAAEYIYKVNGAKLEAGKTKEIKSSAKKSFVLRGKGALEIEAVTTCTSLTLNAAEKPVIVGGQPGKSEKEKVEFGGCTATVGGSKCSTVEVTNVSTKNEIVTVVAPASLKGRLATLFTPTTGTEFSKVKLNKCGIFGTQTATVEGTSAALDEPKEAEAKAGTLVYATGASEITEVEKFGGGGAVKVELKSNKKKATIEGEATVELLSGENWGVF